MEIPCAFVRRFLRLSAEKLLAQRNTFAGSRSDRQTHIRPDISAVELEPASAPDFQHDRRRRHRLTTTTIPDHKKRAKVDETLFGMSSDGVK